MTFRSDYTIHGRFPGNLVGEQNCWIKNLYRQRRRVCSYCYLQQPLEDRL